MFGGFLVCATIIRVEEAFAVAMMPNGSERMVSLEGGRALVSMPHYGIITFADEHLTTVSPGMNIIAPHTSSGSIEVWGLEDTYDALHHALYREQDEWDVVYAALREIKPDLTEDTVNNFLHDVTSTAKGLGRTPEHRRNSVIARQLDDAHKRARRRS